MRSIAGAVVLHCPMSADTLKQAQKMVWSITTIGKVVIIVDPEAGRQG